MISYICGNTGVSVRIDGKVVGEIRRVEGGFQYFPKGHSNGGEILPTVKAVKLTLEAE